MSDHLKAFLRDWIDWVDAGATDHPAFDRHRGLCTTLSRWMHQRGMPYPETSDLRLELKWAFSVDGLDTSYPFGEERYNEFRDRDEQHLDSRRIAWVRSKVE
ncbi:MAG TPA: hypothetical protein VF783_13900 [Terriglobales bacterium]